MKDHQKKDGSKRRFFELFSVRPGRFAAEPYDSSTHYPVIRSSICTGEKVAGFRCKADGSFTEVMLIRSAKDLEEFKETYHLDTVKTEY